MQFTQESKSQLAKLLASENITVEHRNVETAYFDLSSRVLVCPIWKDMSGDLYDLLMGHEVGHATETPAEGWHNAVSSEDKKISRNFRAFLNVVEDARIEKKMKRKFPGLRQPMIRGYNELLKRDFFGISNTDPNALPFIDRLNLHTKGGTNLGIKFNDDEERFLKRVEACETWDDVVDITKAIFDYSKKEQQELSELMRKMAKMHEQMNNDSEDGEEEFPIDDSYGDSYDESDDESDFTSGSQNNEYDESDESGNNSKGGSPEDEDYEGDINRNKESKNLSSHAEPICRTDDAYRENEKQLLDPSNFGYDYVDVPTPVIENIVTPFSRVHQLMEESWLNYYPVTFDDIRTKFYNEFKRKNDRYISLLAKEFEMRKAASKFSKTKISETGDIDVSRIYKYKIDDSIFRKMSRVPKGKSHGLVLIFDRSGSMHSSLRSTIEQIMVLASFCRKVNIPFVVYGFGNDEDAHKLDFSIDRYTGVIKRSFNQTDNTMSLSDVFLREYLNSNMKTSVFTRCMKNLCVLAQCYSDKKSYSSPRFFCPSSESLSNTPMIEALLAMAPITNSFRKKYNLDIVNTVLLHDGDSDGIYSKHVEVMNENEKFMARDHINYKTNVVLRDKKNKFEIVLGKKGFESMQTAIFDWYRRVTNSKLIGFYISGSGRSSLKYAIRSRYVDESNVSISEMDIGLDRYARQMRQDALVENMYKIATKQKFLESNNQGYNKFFILPGGEELAAENESLQINGKVTSSKLKSAFLKMNKTRQISRVLVNRFIGEIAV